MGRKLTNQEFVDRLQSKFPDIQPLEEYKTALTKIKFKCLKCGNIFESKPSNILNSIYGCPKCSIKGVHDKQKIKGKVNMLKSIEGKIEILDDYVNCRTKVRCKCLNCGHIWEAQPYNLTNGYGCPNCKKETVASKLRNSLETIIERARNVHGDFYDYSKVEYKSLDDKVLIGCPIHGYFYQTMYSHINRKCGCPKCQQSHGERLVSQILNKLKVEYSQQYKITYNTNFRKTPTAFIDFRTILNNQEYFIEYNGELHYIAKEHFGGELKLQQQQHRDNVLRQYCIENNIKLLEIPYYIKDDDVEQLIKDFLYE